MMLNIKEYLFQTVLADILQLLWLPETFLKTTQPLIENESLVRSKWQKKFRQESCFKRKLRAINLWLFLPPCTSF